MGNNDDSLKGLGGNEGEITNNKNIINDIVYASDRSGDGKLNFIEYI